ncbi:hypothetical protein Pmani_004853 [Petrolisthes manimaculis]|uniref:DNA polymerase subunit gamma-1 n=1 Tax=Petrolisthes manimaculis TaxID=1843537 RepID=A0AAE1QG09_9EUCA|nr:hypothetical protein Pmani_004853 [Petrolisthes manimaculis]
MASPLHFRNLSSSFRCLLCHPGNPAHTQTPLSFGKIQYLIQRYKYTTIKSPDDISLQTAERNKSQDTSVIRPNERSSPLPSTESCISQKVIKKLSRHIPTRDKSRSNMYSSSAEVAETIHEKETEKKAEEDQDVKTDIVSIKEVVNDVKEELFSSNGRANKTETTFNDSNKKRIVTSKKKLRLIREEKICLIHQSASYTGESFSHKKKILFGPKDINPIPVTPPKPLDVETFESRTNDGHQCKNVVGIQMLSESLHNQIFKNMMPKDSKEAEEDFYDIKRHLEAHHLWDRPTSVSQDIDFILPEFKDEDLDHHFRIIAEDQCVSYKDLLNQLVGASLPSFPNKWEFSPGWTRYNPDGSFTEVGYPDCHALVFDVEVCVKEGSLPTMATAVSDKFWYSWCSNQLIGLGHHSEAECTMKDFIPLETPGNIDKTDYYSVSNAPRIVVGHNVSYDRIRVREQYFMEGTPLRFVDTMSLHIAVSGLVSEQRSLMLKNKKSTKPIRLPWMHVGCQNNLNDVYKFYCKTNQDLQKSTRDIFVKGSLKDVREDFQKLMVYCANDVKATHMVLVKLLPIFFERFPHPVTFSGMLEMGQTFLPVTDNWNKYIMAAESEYRKVEKSLNIELVKQAQAALGLMQDKLYEEDPWLWSLDWALPKSKVKILPGYPNWYRKLCARTGEREGTPEPDNMSTSLQVVPKLLKLTWDGFPLHYEREHGWGYLKPLYQRVSDIPEYEMSEYVPSESGMPVFPVKALYEMVYGKSAAKEEKVLSEEIGDQFIGEEEWEEYLSQETIKMSKNKRARKKEPKQNYVNIGIPGVVLVPLPHKNGAGFRVGNPLAKDFLPKIEDKTLSSYLGDVAELVLKTNKTISYWKNNRDRIMSQLPVWIDHHLLPHSILSSDGYDDGRQYGVILPQVVSAGTITRRAVERTWMTASNAYADRIGSELKAMVEAPPGYKFVGADVDSQELWIAGLLGDAYFMGEHGATAMGWMTLQGKKSDGTDMHSRTAHTTNISRDNAKVINYGRIYGAGLKFIQRLLKQFNPKISEEVMKERAEQLYTSTKGERAWHLSEVGLQLAADLGYDYAGHPLTRSGIRKLLLEAQANGLFDASFADISDGPPVWFGGSESHMFNCLEAIARSEVPRTPVLGAKITRALQPWCVDDEFMTSRVNWVVQSSAVDYLHIMLVCMRWLFKKYEISGRFCISIHDEVRYMVASEDCHRAALALQITNLLTRSYFAQRLEFQNLPQSVAFFSGVDIDCVLRKEPHLDCVTPSNPEGLHKGYGFPPGVTLDMQQIMEITNGDLTKHKPVV